MRPVSPDPLPVGESLLLNVLKSTARKLPVLTDEAVAIESAWPDTDRPLAVPIVTSPVLVPLRFDPVMVPVITTLDP